MRVLSLGGCGQMGRHFVETAVKLKAFEKLTIADYNEVVAKEYVKQLDNPLIDAIQIDAHDSIRLTEILKEYDVVVSTIGPYYLFGTVVLEAAIDANCHYIDICDDPDPTLELLKLCEKAKKNNITAIIGMGASPGIANLLASKAIGTLGVVENVITTWGSLSLTDELDNMEPEMGAALEHWVEQFTGTITVFKNKKLVKVRPLKTLKFRVPSLGHIKTHTIGHPEPVTLPRTFPSIQSSNNAMVFSRVLIQTLKIAQKRVDKKGHSIKQVADVLRKVFIQSDLSDLSFFETMKIMLASTQDSIFGRKYMPAEISATVSREEQNKEYVCSAWLNGAIPGGMGPNTSVPTAIALRMLGDGNITKYGVYAPEGIINPDIFFDLLEPFVTKKNTNLPLISVKSEVYS
ncbi:MAG: saccharopine dehydrogenase-like NADP-dependent oxidoreductase [Francisellaceae bacterium]|jgi:saccharopine dehydrogenase-like NADP-dependent oxidoreductase